MPLTSPPWFRLLLPVALLLVAQPASAQRPLDHADVLGWKQIADPSLSPDGNWVTFSLDPFEGDPSVVVRAASAGAAELTLRGQRPAFTSDSRFVVLSVPPLKAVLDSLKLEGKKGDALPKDSLAIVDLAGGPSGAAAAPAKVSVLGPVRSYSLAETGDWVAYLLEEAAEADETEPRDPTAAEGEDDVPEAKKKEDGHTLVVRKLDTGAEQRLDHVSEYVFSENGTVLAYTTQTEDGSADGAWALALGSDSPRELLAGPGHYTGITASNAGDQIAFLANQSNWANDRPEHELYVARGSEGAQRVAGSSDAPTGWVLSEHGDLVFADDATTLRFGMAPRPAPEPEYDIPEDERVQLDVWNWKDPYLQPMQLVQLDEERKRTYAAVVHLDGARAGAVVTLGSPEVPDVAFAEEASARFALGTTDFPYRQLISWDGRYTDAHAVDTRSGERRLLAEGIKGFGGARISPAGGWAFWWDGAAKQWMGASLADGAPIPLSAGAQHPLWNELDDHPDEPPPYGAAGWTEDDRAFIYYDGYDLFRFEPASGRTANLTDGYGRAHGVRLRYEALDPEATTVVSGQALFSAFNPEGKQRGFMRGRTDQAQAPTPVVMEEKSFRVRAKADDVERWLITREDFREFPDLWVTDGSFTDLARVSDANPEQAEFAWGDARLVEWTSNDGIPLQGMLFTPDGFDESKQYPMMVYFYERMSDGLYSYRAPTPGGSSVSVPFYVSRGYTVFVPDIPYEIGYPGESALDAVVPGVLSLIDKGFVDPDRVGVQGHSWGGYQIAYMITKTNLFAAAEAGAPVSNMTSAYGGIRWQTGMSRAFQYERTQSRIGGSLWEATDEYLHNSPLFYADKIQTPLLMMHNDEDGAVPWYQGIEMFVGMRRLQKPVWMLNYNGEAHGLRKDHNRKDWAIRMQQFFDHYLMGAPAPVWMEEGVPALLKGQTLGTELKAPVGAGVSE